MLRVLFSALIVLFLPLAGYADFLDLSIDDEIRKNYNPNQIEIDMGLPPLPQVNNLEKIEYINDDGVIPTPKNTQKVIKNQADILNSTQTSYTKMKKGRVIKLKSRCTISDTMRKGTRVTFLSTYPVSTTYFSIPGGSKFIGEIVDVHRPQFTGNGGLIVIKIISVELYGKTLPISAEVRKIVTNGKSKRIFYNNIKGKRKYASNMVHATDKGTKFCKKMYTVGSRFWRKGGLNMIITPLTDITGTLVWAGNVISSPVMAGFSRGGSVSIPKGSIFEVKLTEDFYINK